MSLRSLLGAVARTLLHRPTTTTRPGSGTKPGPRAGSRSGGRTGGGAVAVGAITEYDLRRRGRPTLDYSPHADGQADPGEVVWGWVPYEDDPLQGKDRPVLIVGRSKGDLVGLQLTSKDHGRRRGVEEDQYGRVWLDVGTGGWDRQGRDSEVRIDRLLLVPEAAVRREGSQVSKKVFLSVVNALAGHFGWG